MSEAALPEDADAAGSSYAAALRGRALPAAAEQFPELGHPADADDNDGSGEWKQSKSRRADKRQQARERRDQRVRRERRERPPRVAQTAGSGEEASAPRGAVEPPSGGAAAEATVDPATAETAEEPKQFVDAPPPKKNAWNKNGAPDTSATVSRPAAVVAAEPHEQAEQPTAAASEPVSEGATTAAAQSPAPVPGKARLSV